MIGTSVVEIVTLYKVEIEGRGGDSSREEYFETPEAAILASAVDGKNLEPTREDVLKLSDGTFILMPVFVHISQPPSKEQVAKLIGNLPPALKMLVSQKK
jgi:hypothetical protein